MRIEPLRHHRSRLPEVAQLLHEEWSRLAPWSSQPQIEKRLFAGIASGPFPFAFVALSADGGVLGTSSVKLHELTDVETEMHWLGEVITRKEFRGQGVGSALIRACIDHAFNQAVPALYLYTPDQQLLYSRFGWVRIRDTLVNGESVSVMVLNNPGNS